MDSLCGDLYKEARQLKLPEPPAGEGADFHAVAQYLKVYVKKSTGAVRLTMPARVADDLEGIIDPPVKETIHNQGLDLAAMQEKVRRSGFTPQDIFNIKDDVREVHVWLE